MSIAGAARVRNEMCTMRLCVDDHKSGEIAGRLFNAYYQNPIYFDNWIQLIKHMESCFTEFGYPHETMTRRSFEKYRDINPDEEEAGANAVKLRLVGADSKKQIERRRPVGPVRPSVLYTHKTLGKLATFEVKVMFRQNASWQGMARWVEEEASEDFASTLELMYLIENSFDA